MEPSGLTKKEMARISRQYRDVRLRCWLAISSLYERVEENSPHKKILNRLLTVAQVSLDVVSYVVNNEGDCEDNAWQLALALLELCEAIHGEQNEQCLQEFQTNLAIFLQPCEAGPGGTG